MVHFGTQRRSWELNLALQGLYMVHFGDWLSPWEVNSARPGSNMVHFELLGTQFRSIGFDWGLNLALWGSSGCSI